jgi:hypothetical protein
MICPFRLLKLRLLKNSWKARWEKKEGLMNKRIDTKMIKEQLRKKNFLRGRSRCCHLQANNLKNTTTILITLIKTRNPESISKDQCHHLNPLSHIKMKVLRIQHREIIHKSKNMNLLNKKRFKVMKYNKYKFHKNWMKMITNNQKVRKLYQRSHS